jgi:hypothetical protein
MRTQAIVLALALAVVAGLGSVGCSKQLQKVIIPNQPPTVILTWAPIDSQKPEFYSYMMNWVGNDPDGRVVGFQYAVNPSAEEDKIVWNPTTANELQIDFPALLPEPGFQGDTNPRSMSFNVFAIRAVDNQGAVSETVLRAFTAFGLSPEATILMPTPQSFRPAKISPAVLIRWDGKDYKGADPASKEKPLYYRYKLYKEFDPGVNWTAWMQDPDSLRREVAPEFKGWDLIGPDTPEKQYLDLTSGSNYLFVVVAFGRSGAYSPIFRLKSSNMLWMKVETTGILSLGPTITMFNSFFQYTYPSGGYSLDFSRAIPLQVPAGKPITFNWIAQPTAGSLMKSYRWVLDLVVLDDTTRRTIEQDDWYHWSKWTDATAATIGPFAGSVGDVGEVHNFYLEAEDINGYRSLGWVQFRVFRPMFDKDLLVVNDTRLQVDELSTVQPPGRTDSLRAPYGPWPSRAELDTFLFAVGGMPWKMKAGRRSPQGVLRGYSFDTLGTRYGQVDPTIPLGVLGHYKHVIWMSNNAPAYALAANKPTLPMPTLLYMSAPGRQNTLSTWVGQGGKLWALGGGFGDVTNKGIWNNTANDVPVTTYSYVSLRPDLVPGRFMFDLAHWRSEFRVVKGFFPRFSRLDQPDPTVIGYPRPPVYWKGGKFTNPDVNYTSLPTTLQFRSQATDPLWPNRTAAQFNVGNKAAGGTTGIDIEFLNVEHRMLEEMPGSTPGSTVERSVLDTLYLVYGSGGELNQSSAGAGVNAVMTYYYGRDNAPLVFSGMAIWDFRRQDCLALVNFVLGNLWGLSKSTIYPAPNAVAPNLTRRAAVPAPQPFQRPPGSVRRPVGTSTQQRRR